MGLSTLAFISDIITKLWYYNLLIYIFIENNRFLPFRTTKKHILEKLFQYAYWYEIIKPQQHTLINGFNRWYLYNWSKELGSTNKILISLKNAFLDIKNRIAYEIKNT